MKPISAKYKNLGRIVRTWRAAVLAALLAGLFVPGWTLMAQAQSRESTTSPTAVNPGKRNGYSLSGAAYSAR